MGQRSMEIGMVGCGVIGKATAMLFEPDWVYDPPLNMTETGNDNVSSVIFICVGTPLKDGRCDLSIVRDSVERFKDRGLLVLRSTVPPGTARQLAAEFKTRIVSNPEFLREKTSEYDAQHPRRIVIGADDAADGKIIKDMYKKAPINWSDCFGFVETDTVTAELIKFTTNLLGACKVSLANEIYDVCQAIGADFDTVREAVYRDPRLGFGFFAIGAKRGWGGRCFPKDMEMFLHWLAENKLESLVLKAARDANLKYRELGDES